MDEDFIRVSVTEPKKCSDSISTYITYKVTCETNRGGFARGEGSVVRRYSEFTWLAEVLARTCPGSIVPAIPEKQAMGRFSSDFVEARRRALERFLQRIATHPELGRSEHYATFLQADDAALKRAMEASKASKPKMMTAAKAWLDGSFNTISNAGKVMI